MSRSHARWIRTIVAAVVAVPALASAQLPTNTGAVVVAGVDQRWDVSLNGGAFFDAFLVTAGIPGSWEPNTATYRWISAEADASTGTGSTYLYRTMFDLTGYDLSTVAIGFLCAKDNSGGSYTLNGGAAVSNACNATNVFTFGAQQTLTAASGLVAGMNTLQIATAGDGTTDALLVNFNSFAGRQGQSVVPEPASVALMATGLLVIGGIARRRRSA